MCFGDEPGAPAALDEEFEHWLAGYRDGELDGMLTAQFLTRRHLQAAFAAGVSAHARAEAAGIAMVREAGMRAWDQHRG